MLGIWLSNAMPFIRRHHYMFKYIESGAFYPEDTHLTLKTSDLCVLIIQCVPYSWKKSNPFWLLSVWACLLRERVMVKERKRGGGVSPDARCCWSLCLCSGVSEGGSRWIQPGRQTKKVESVRVGGLLSGTDIITACNIFNSRLSRSVVAFRALTLSRERAEQQQTDFIYCN